MIQQMFMGIQPSKVALMTATGGTITYDGDFAVHTFTADGFFTLTYKATTGLTFQLLAIFAQPGGAGADVTGSDTEGGGGGGGGASYCNNFASLSVDSVLQISTACGVEVSAPGTNKTSYLFSPYNTTSYSASGAGSTYLAGGSGGGGGNDGYLGDNGISNSITGSAVVYGGGGGGGGGGGSIAYGPGSGAVSTNGGGSGGSGGSTGNNGDTGGNATSGIGRGGGGGGGAGTDESQDYFGGVGGLPNAGVVIIRYRYQQ